MKLRGIDFGNVWCASGAMGFFGELDDPEYWNHRLSWPFSPDFRGITFVAKTTTLKPRLGPDRGGGNMPLDDEWKPKEWFPRCIKVKLRHGVALNAVGLSGPGAEALLRTGKWQARKDPFFLSFMSVAETKKERLSELL